MARGAKKKITTRSEEYIINNGGIALRYFNVYGPGEEHKNNG